MRALALAWTAAVLLALGGCGFHLAAEGPLPPELATVFIDASTPYRVSEQPVQTALHKKLVGRGGTVLAKSQPDASIVRLWDFSEQRQTLSIGPDGKALEYRMVISMRYQLLHQGRVLVEADQLSVTRDFSFTIDQILAKENEEQQLRIFMQDEMAELLLLRFETALRRQLPQAPPLPVPQIIPSSPAASAPAN